MATDRREYYRAYYAKNRDRIAATNRAWHERNAEKMRTYIRDYQIVNRERIRERHRQWRKESPAYKRSSQATGLKRFGITIEIYEQMLQAQGGVCGLCGRPPPPKRRLAVDHCHRTGTVRGLLCHTCNTALGIIEKYQENPTAIDRWIRRSSPPTPRQDRWRVG